MLEIDRKVGIAVKYLGDERMYEEDAFRATNRGKCC